MKLFMNQRGRQRANNFLDEMAYRFSTSSTRFVLSYVDTHSSCRFSIMPNGVAVLMSYAQNHPSREGKDAQTYNVVAHKISAFVRKP